MERDIRLEELDSLRQQLTLLNRKLEKQSIINHQLIRNSMKERISNINRTGIVLCALVVIATPMVAYNFHYILHISLALNLFTCIFLIISVFYTIWSHAGLNGKLLNGNLVTATNTILRTRRRYHQWYYFSYPWFAVWICWVGYEIYTEVDTPEMLVGCMVGGIVGGIIGGIWGIRQRNKIYRNIDAMLQDIADLKSEE